MGFLQDFKFGFRMLIKNPGFTLVAVITIALGIGVNSTVFTLSNAVLLKGLPFEDPASILHISSADPAHGRPRFPVSYKDFVDYREQSKSFTDLGAYGPVAIDLSDDSGSAERVSGSRLTANMFSLLGQKPLRGRDFKSGEDLPSAEPVALIGYGLWQTRYGGREDVIGKSVKGNQKFYTIVGIMPQGMKFPNNEDMWLPLVRGDADEKRSSRSYNVIGRRKSGVSSQTALNELKGIAGNLEQSFPDTNKDIQVTVQGSSEFYNGGPIRTVFYVMQGAVAFVLLIVCANVANLLLARAVRRTRETSIRTALGANRWRIVRQFLIESILLSFVGGFIGLGLSMFGVRLFDAAVQNSGKPYWIVFTFDYNVALFFFAVCVITGILFGLAPALQISRANVGEHLKEGGRSSSGGLRARRLTGALLIGEIGLTIVLLVGAGLMVRSFLNSQLFDLGIRSQNLVVARVAVRGPKYPEPSNILSFEQRLTERLRQIQGVESLTVAASAPASGSSSRRLKLADRDLADANNKYPNVNMLIVDAGYFTALGVNVVRGREFNDTDGASGAEVAIVNESFIRQYWPNQDPLGKQIRLGDKDDSPWIQVVGISPKILQIPSGPGQQQDMYPPLVYIPFRQEPVAGFNILVRSGVARDLVSAELRNGLREIDAELPLFNISTMDELIAQRSWPFRVFGTLFATFAFIALLMSSVGIYGVTAYGISQRTQEIGVRMALGATTKQVMWLVLRQGLVRITVGLALGILAALGMSRVLATLLFQVTATDPLTFISISLLLTLVTITACAIPARRAMRMDPSISLRRE